MNKTILVIWLFTLVLAVGMPLVNYSTLPDRMASHFEFSGKANGYSSKDSFYLMWFIQIAILNVMVPGVGWLVRKVPPGMVNIPHREYWLATPERRRECGSKSTGLLAVIMSCVNLFLVGLFQSVLDVNSGQSPALPFWLPLLLLPITGILTLVYVLKVFKVPQQPSPKNPTAS